MWPLSKTCALSLMSITSQCKHPLSPYRQRSYSPYPQKSIIDSTRCHDSDVLLSFFFISLSHLALTLMDTSQTETQSINPLYSATLPTLISVISPPMYKLGHYVSPTSLLSQPFLSFFLRPPPIHSLSYKTTSFTQV
jgi:hypothetical protein